MKISLVYETYNKIEIIYLEFENYIKLCFVFNKITNVCTYLTVYTIRQIDSFNSCIYSINDINVNPELIDLCIRYIKLNRNGRVENKS